MATVHGHKILDTQNKYYPYIAYKGKFDDFQPALYYCNVSNICK